MAKAKKTAKKSAPKKQARLPQAPAEQFFVLLDGRVLKDYKELADLFEHMEDHVYGHHVNWERNDFARWIEDVFGERELAETLRRAQSKHHSQIVIYRHILDRL